MLTVTPRSHPMPGVIFQCIQQVLRSTVIKLFFDASVISLQSTGTLFSLPHSVKQTIKHSLPCLALRKCQACSFTLKLHNNPVKSDKRYISRVSDQNGISQLYIIVNIEGSRPEWCISSMMYSRDTPFWSKTLYAIQVGKP